MMTKSPPSTCGAKVGLCLPRSSVAAWVARRPRTTSVASMTNHSRVISPALGLYVRMGPLLSLARRDLDSVRTTAHAEL